MWSSRFLRIAFNKQKCVECVLFIFTLIFVKSHTRSHYHIWMKYEVQLRIKPLCMPGVSHTSSHYPVLFFKVSLFNSHIRSGLTSKNTVALIKTGCSWIGTRQGLVTWYIYRCDWLKELSRVWYVEQINKLSFGYWEIILLLLSLLTYVFDDVWLL